MRVLYVLPIIIFLFSSLFAVVTNDYRDFSVRHHVFYKGDLASIGNSVLVPPTTQNSTICSTYTNGPYYSNVANSNASYYLCGYQVDSGTTNSTTAELNLPAGATVEWAGLYWQALVADGSFSTDMNIKIKKDSGAYTTISYDDLDYLSGSGKSGYTSYSAFKNLTEMFTSNNWADGNYTVADIPVVEGKVDTLGTYGAWNLVVIYEDLLSTTQKFRSFTVFDGWKVVKNADDYRDVQIDLSGFYTPKTTPINASVSIFTAEGDKHIYNDYLKTFNYNTSPPTSVNLMPPGETKQTFNSSISGTNFRIPNLINNNGIDIQTHDIGDYLTTEQTSAEFHFTSTQDTYWPSVLAFTTELYVPKFCYDYAYKQQGKYFTEENDGTKDPRLVGSVIEDENGDLDTSVDVTIFLRNLVDSDIEVKDMTISILDMNTTQVTYKRDTTSLAMIPNIIPIEILDSSISVSDSDIENINIGDMSSNDYFYLYYSLNPQQSDLNMSINVHGTYNLLLEGTGETIPYKIELGSTIDMCSSTNFNYTPIKGMFNIVHNNYYPHSDGNNYYNLPTQVTSREGSFKAIVMDPDNLDSLKALPNKTKVAVELIDISAFHDTFASCKELESAITPRVWVEFDANTASTMFNKNTLVVAAAKANALEAAGGGTSKLPNSYDFYKVANENTAFRISYNTHSENDFVLDYTETNPGEYKINNFSDAVKVGTCSQDVFYFDKNGNFKKDVKQVSQACGNSGTSISESQLDACLECLYGYNTKLVCSRDNFSLRPEAFLMHLNDQNQTVPTNPFTPPERLTNNFSGIAGATTSVLNLAADYNYTLEVSATNHINNNASPGYTKSFNSSNFNDKSEYTWEPRGLTTAQLLAKNTACNDDTNKSTDMRFVDGVVDVNTSVRQVGEYSLGIVDKTWTTVDNNPIFMTHHIAPHFIAGSDCIDGSSDTQAVNSATNNGCFISSQHINNEANLQYNDYDVVFHPYKYNISNTITLGLTNRDINTTDDFSNFVYMANINEPEDINMSVQFNSTIAPQGYSGASLTNFVTGCFAKPIDINISKSAPQNTQLNLRYIINDRNTTGTASGFIANVADEDANLTTTVDFFAKDMNGVLSSITNLNFDRQRDRVANPEDINYSKITVSDPRTLLSADLLTNKIADGNITINGLQGQNITHYFGRTAAKRTRIICDEFPCLSGENQEPDVLIYYEAYCHGITNSNTCDRDLIPRLGARHIQRVDSRWFVNLNHQELGDGNLTATSQVGNNFVTVPNIRNRNNYTKDSVHSYNGNGGLPYDANMQSVVPRWLMYDEETPGVGAVTNKHLIHYLSPTEWSGKHETNTTTGTQRVRRVNRRTMW